MKELTSREIAVLICVCIAKEIADKWSIGEASYSMDGVPGECGPISLEAISLWMPNVTFAVCENGDISATWNPEHKIPSFITL